MDEILNRHRLPYEGAAGRSTDNGKEIIMIRTFLITSAAALSFIVAPASAQLLGGGGLGGSLGGGLSGGLNGTLDGATSSVRGTTDGTLSGTASTRGNQHVDRKSGSVSADRSVSGAAAGAVNQTLDTPARSVSSNASGNSSANAGANGNAQLIGTDAVRQNVASTRATVKDTTSSTLRAAGDGSAKAAGFAHRATANGKGAAQGSANGASSLAGSNLVAAGSAASTAAGAFAVSPGMDIQTIKGEAIGTVRNVETDAHGKVQSLLIEVDNRTAKLPAGNFSANGNALVSAMGSGEIKKAAKQQAGYKPATKG